MSTTCLEALELVAEASGVEFDPLVAKQAIVDAGRQVPGDHRDAWRERLVRAGKDVGLRVTAFRCSVREAGASASPARPFVACPSGGPEAGNCLVVTGRRGRRVRVAEGGAGRWVGEAELARTLGLGGPKDAAEWALMQPIAPCEGLGDPAAGDHDHGHGHGDHEAMSPLRRLIGLIRPEGGDIRVVVVFAVGVGVLSLATPLAVEALVSTVAMNLLVQQLVVLSFVLLACLSLAAAMRALQTCVVEAIQQRVFVRVTSDLAYRLPRVRVDAFDRENGPELVNRFFDVLTVQKVGALLLLDGIAIVLQSVIGLLVLAFYHPYLLGFSLVILGAMAFTIFQLGRGAVATSIKESRAKYAVAGRLEELVLAPLAYKLGGGAEFAMDRADVLARRYLAARRDHFRIVLRQVVFALALQAIASTALLGLGGWLVIQGQLTLGQLVAAELIVVTVVSSFTKLGKHLEGWYDLMAAVEKLGHLVDLPLERRDGEAHREEGVEGSSLRLRSVAFGYDGRGAVLDGLDLDVHPGERVAIVGPSGSGKSTLVDLLYGLRAPTGGHVEIDGVNLRDLRLDALRERVAVVKGLEVIEGTVIENLRVGRPAIALGDVRQALDAVGLLGALSALPDGLQTRLAAGGAPLSLGQARRLMLARAIVGRPRLLVLDESLDGLDLDAGRRTRESLFDRSAPWTLMVVTHSQDVAARCDRAVALSAGKADRSAAMANGRSPNLEDLLKEGH